MNNIYIYELKFIKAYSLVFTIVIQTIRKWFTKKTKYNLKFLILYKAEVGWDFFDNE